MQHVSSTSTVQLMYQSLVPFTTNSYSDRSTIPKTNYNLALAAFFERYPTASPFASSAMPRLAWYPAGPIP